MSEREAAAEPLAQGHGHGAAAAEVDPAAPPQRRELELALRAAHLAIAELREDLHALAAQVVALTELAAPTGERERFEAEVESRTGALRRELALADHGAAGRLLLASPEDKYAIATDDGPPCAELLPLCQARCCRFEVALSTQDLDEGRLRWDLAVPYALARRADGQCVHHDGRGCQAYEVRPATCRRYDCRTDSRVWLDYERGLVAPMPTATAAPDREAVERQARDGALARFVEASRLRRRS